MGANITGVWLPWGRRGSFPPFLVLYPSVYSEKGRREHAYRATTQRVSNFVLLDRPKSHEISMRGPLPLLGYVLPRITPLDFGEGGGPRRKSRRGLIINRPN